MSRRVFWPAAEAAQADYEALRAAIFDGAPAEDLAAARFARRGLAGLIAWPTAEPAFTADLIGAARPAWHPHEDPRIEALAAGFGFLLDTEEATNEGTPALAMGGEL